MDVKLNEDDLATVVEELHPVRHKSRLLGVLLGLPMHVVESIHHDRLDLTDQLLHIIMECINQEPGLTWRDIIKALRSRPLGEQHCLANEIEKKYFGNAQEDVLTPSDAAAVFETLFPAMSKSLILGLVLGLPAHEVESIHSSFSDPKERLLRIIIAYLKTTQPTWGAIVNALRRPAMNMRALADEIEAAYLSHQIFSHSLAVETPISGITNMDVTLKEDDLATIINELHPVQHKSRLLGVLLRLPMHVVEAVHHETLDPPDQLLHIIVKCINQEPGLTWRDIIKALRSRPLGEYHLADEIEKKYCGNVQEDVLTSSDAAAVLDALFPAMSKSFVLGLVLGLPTHEVECIHSSFSDPKERLLRIIIAYLKTTQPTWGAIVNALRRPGMNMHALADEVEAAYLSHLISSHGLEIERPTTTDAPFKLKEAPHSDPPVAGTRGLSNTDRLKGLPPADDKDLEVQREIKSFTIHFNAIKESTIKCLEACHIAVMTVVYMLLSVVSGNEQQKVLRQNYRSLRESKDHLELFSKLNPHWNYLSYDMLDLLIEELRIIDGNFETVGVQMDVYKKELQEFRMNTPLDQFCEALPYEEHELSPTFHKSVIEYPWPQIITLEDVYVFHNHFAQSYKLQSLAMMVKSVISDTLKAELPDAAQQHQMGPAAASGLATPGPPMIDKRGKTEYLPFVEVPSDSFYCPVTFELLHQPHLTSCCGHHLSAEAVTRVQGADFPCPVCGTSPWHTMLDKKFQRQVRELSVFCSNENRGCVWQGELHQLDSHVESCSMRTAPLLRDLVHMKGDKIVVSDVPLLKEQSFVYTGKTLDFIWEEAGIDMHFPAASCEESIDISVKCMTKVEENSILPHGYRLMPMASATYKIKTSATFPAPVSVRIQHCAITNNKYSLVFMVAHNGPPYHFQPLQGGKFPPGESYGEIEVKKFCYLSIFYNFLNYFHYKMSLAVHIAYLGDNGAHFLLTKNIPANRKKVMEEYHQSALKIDSFTMTCYLFTTEVSLKVPEAQENGWLIQPNPTPPRINMCDVCAYEPGCVIPKIELKLTWRGREPRRIMDFNIGIQGGDKHSFILTAGKKQSDSQQVQLYQPSQEQQPQPSLPHQPQIMEASSHPIRGEIGRMASENKPEHAELIKELENLSWEEVKNMAVQLEDGDMTLEVLERIERRYSSESERLSKAMHEWLERDTGASWAKVVAALRVIKKNKLAEKLVELYPSLR